MITESSHSRLYELVGVRKVEKKFRHCSECEDLSPTTGCEAVGIQCQVKKPESKKKNVINFK